MAFSFGFGATEGAAIPNDEGFAAGDKGVKMTAKTREVIWTEARESSGPCEIVHVPGWEGRTLEMKKVPAVGDRDSDLVAGVYEGGMKLWECSLDLVQFLDAPRWRSRIQGARVLELGCGHGLPGLLALHHGAAAVHMQVGGVLRSTEAGGVQCVC